MFNTTFANDLIKLLLTGVNIANIADNAASAPLTSLYIALHTGDPGAGGAQNTNEVSYTGYARVAVARTGSAWSITNNVANPAARIEFGEMTAGVASQATWMSIGTSASGAGKVLLRGLLSPAIAIALGVIPAIKQDSTITFVTT